MRIIVDLDGTICNLKKDGQDYVDVLPLPGAIEKIQKFKEQGHYIIIQTARHMKTTSGNVGLIQKKIGQKTMNRLDRYNIPYDEIFFGKPHGDIYIDDNAKEFNGRNYIQDIEDFIENKIQVVIPAAGAGSRFAKAGYTIPKPLIPVGEKTMIEWAVSGLVDSLSATFTLDFIFIVLQAHIEQFHIDTFLQEKYPGCKIIGLEGMTRGQAETVLQAKDYINNNNKLVIYNADTYSTYDQDFIELLQNPAIDGIIPCFCHNDPRYSYAKLDQYNYVDLVAEKKIISPHATNGLYYFRQGKRFVNACETMIKENKTENGEFYVGPLYNYLIDNGQRIKVSGIKENWVIGTPDELDYFLKNYGGN